MTLNANALKGFPLEQTEAHGNEGYMFVGQRVAIWTESKLADRVSAWTSTNPTVISAKGTSWLRGELEAHQIGDATITATLSYSDGSRATADLFTCAPTVCTLVQRIRVRE